MQYLLLVYVDESTGPAPDSTEEEAMWVAHEDFSRRIGLPSLVDARSLHPSDTATTVRHRNGSTYTSDGPFETTSEQLAEFYLIEADDLDAAIAMAARVPGAKYGSVEVRPVVDMASGCT